MALPTKYTHQVTQGTEVYHESEELIESLAELAGFTAYKILDENSCFAGYIIEANDKELQEFLSAETASEKDELLVVSSMGSFLGDD